MRAAMYACDGCGIEQPDDGWQPEGWIHTMEGRDLCPRCETYTTGYAE